MMAFGRRSNGVLLSTWRLHGIIKMMIIIQKQNQKHQGGFCRPSTSKKTKREPWKQKEGVGAGTFRKNKNKTYFGFFPLKRNGKY